MPKKTAQPRKVKVPTNAPMVLVTINNMLRMRRQELQAVIEAGQAYARSVRLDPTKDYRFEVEGDKVYAIEQAVQEKVAEAKE